MFQLYETDADLSQDPSKLLYQNHSFDLVETVAAVEWCARDFGVDLMVYNQSTCEIKFTLLTPETHARRGECLG